MVASLLETVVITNIQLKSTHGPIPDWLWTLVLHYLALVVCLPPSKKKRTVTVFINPSASGTGGTFLFAKTLKGDLVFSHIVTFSILKIQENMLDLNAFEVDRPILWVHQTEMQIRTEICNVTYVR